MELLTRFKDAPEKMVDYTEEQIEDFKAQTKGKLYELYVDYNIKFQFDLNGTFMHDGFRKKIMIPIEDYVIEDGKVIGFMPRKYFFWDGNLKSRTYRYDYDGITPKRVDEPYETFFPIDQKKYENMHEERTEDEERFYHLRIGGGAPEYAFVPAEEE